MSTYDEWKATDEAGDDNDVRPYLTIECMHGLHADCRPPYVDAACECDCHAEPPESRACDPTPCAKCGKLPKDCVWQCRRCGAVAEVIPYPVIGCECVARGYTCDACLYARKEWSKDNDND